MSDVPEKKSAPVRDMQDQSKRPGMCHDHLLTFLLSNKSQNSVSTPHIFRISTASGISTTDALFLYRLMNPWDKISSSFCKWENQDTETLSN